MATKFDPTKYGATAFNPQDYGATQVKGPNALSRIVGGVSRILNVPVSALSSSAKVIGGVIGGLSAGSFSTANKAVEEFNKEITSIPSEVGKGFTQGFWSESQMMSPSKALGISGIGGLAVDIGGDPLNLLFIKPIEKIGVFVAPKIGEGAKTAKSIFTVGREIKKAETELIKQPLQRLNLQTVITDVRNANKGQISEMTKSFQNAGAELGKALSSESQMQSVVVKNDLKTLFSNMTKTYGDGLAKVENVLVQNGTTISSKNYLNKVLKNTLSEIAQRAVPEENSLVKFLIKTKDNLTKLPDTKISINELQKFKNTVIESVSAGVKTGTKYISDIDDQVASIFLKNHGQFFGNLSPELSRLNKSFATMANARTWAIRTFRPFNEAEIQRGANVLMKIAKGEMPDKTILNYLKILEKGSGEFEGAGKLTGEVLKTGKEIRDLKSAFNMAKYNLTRATDLQIQNLRKDIAVLSGRGIELTQKINKLKNLRKWRNIIIGATIGWKVLPDSIKKLIF